MGDLGYGSPGVSNYKLKGILGKTFILGLCNNLDKSIIEIISSLL